MRNVISMSFMLGMVFSQSAGYFANSGETIIGIEGQYDSESDANSSSTTTTLGGSYVLNGNLEVAGFYTMANVDDETEFDLDYDISGLTFGGYYHLLSNENLPVNIKLGGFYGDHSASADWLDDAGFELKSKATSIGGGVYRNISQNDAMTIVGFFEFQSVTSEAVVSDSYGNEDITKDDYGSTSFGLSIRNGNFFVTPSISRNDDDSSFGVSIGSLIPQ